MQFLIKLYLHDSFFINRYLFEVDRHRLNILADVGLWIVTILASNGIEWIIEFRKNSGVYFFVINFLVFTCLSSLIIIIGIRSAWRWIRLTLRWLCFSGSRWRRRLVLRLLYLTIITIYKRVRWSTWQIIDRAICWWIR